MSDSIRDQTIGARIRSTRKGRGLTQKDVSKVTGISQAHLSDVERGYAAISRPYLKLIAGALGVSTGFLISGDDSGGEIQLTVTRDEQELLQAYRRLPDTARAHLISLLDNLFGTRGGDKQARQVESKVSALPPRPSARPRTPPAEEPPRPLSLVAKVVPFERRPQVEQLPRATNDDLSIEHASEQLVRPIRLPLIGRVVDADGSVDICRDPAERVSVPTSLARPGWGVVRIETDAMGPDYIFGDSLLVSDEAPRDGDVALVMLSDVEYWVRKIAHHPDGADRWSLLALESSHEPIAIAKHDVRRMERVERIFRARPTPGA